MCIYIYMCVCVVYTTLKCSYSQTCRIIYNNYLYVYVYTAIEEDLRYGKYARSMNIDLHMLYGKKLTTIKLIAAVR